MKIKFCGAAQTVTGSCHLLTLDNGYKILMDCGLYQGYEDKYEKFNEGWLFEPEDIDCMILSHAHIDHSGRIPKLCKDGFKGNIFSTHATRDLAAIMLQDSGFIQERDAEYNNKNRKKFNTEKKVPLYTVKDAERSLEQFVSVAYERWNNVGPGVDVLFRDAGHILGSASVTLRVKVDAHHTEYFGFTGDIGRPDRPILKNPIPMEELDYLICESTYGGKEHSSAPQDENALLEIIQQTCVEQKGKLIIPAFSVGRTQEIVYMMDRLETAGKLPNIPVYVDSPLAINATEIFQMHPECFDQDILDYMRQDPNPFGFHNLRYTKRVEDSKMINTLDQPCVVISASGMATAGRIRHHIFHNIGKAKNTILIVGYCAPHTLGGQLRDGKEEVKMFGQLIEVKAQVKVMDSFSAHGDHSEILDFIDNQDRSKLKKIFLTHGDVPRQTLLQTDMVKMGFKKVEIPSLGQSFNI